MIELERGNGFEWVGGPACVDGFEWMAGFERIWMDMNGWAWMREDGRLNLNGWVYTSCWN